MASMTIREKAMDFVISASNFMNTDYRTLNAYAFTGYLLDNVVNNNSETLEMDRDILEEYWDLFNQDFYNLAGGK